MYLKPERESESDGLTGVCVCVCVGGRGGGGGGGPAEHYASPRDPLSPSNCGRKALAPPRRVRARLQSRAHAPARSAVGNMRLVKLLCFAAGSAIGLLRSRSTQTQIVWRPCTSLRFPFRRRLVSILCDLNKLSLLHSWAFHAVASDSCGSAGSQWRAFVIQYAFRGRFFSLTAVPILLSPAGKAPCAMVPTFDKHFNSDCYGETSNLLILNAGFTFRHQIDICASRDVTFPQFVSCSLACGSL